MDLRDALQVELNEQGIPGVVTHYLLTVALTGTDGHERIITTASEGVGMSMHLGLASAAKLTAEQRYFTGDDEEPEEGQAD